MIRLTHEYAAEFNEEQGVLIIRLNVMPEGFEPHWKDAAHISSKEYLETEVEPGVTVAKLIGENQDAVQKLDWFFKE